MNSLLSETNFNIFENVILPKCSTLIILRHVHKEYWNIKQSGNQLTSTSSDRSEPVRIAWSEQPDRTSQFGPPVRTTKRNTHNSWFPKALKVHEYSWKAYEVYFLTQQVSRHFDFPIRIYDRIIEDCSECQESARGFILLNFPYKTVAFYIVSWRMPHKHGKLIKSSFTPNKRLIVSTSE